MDRNAYRPHSAALCLCALLAACGRSSPPLAQTAYEPAPEIVQPPAQLYGNDWMYSSQANGNDATVYKRNKHGLTPFETLYPNINAPQGTIATPDGWWYLTNGGHANVLIYRSTRRGPKGPVDSLADAGALPVNVALTADREIVAVSNGTTAASGTGSVSVYLHRQHNPTRVLAYGRSIVEGQGVTIDRHGNCYWSFNDVSKPEYGGEIVAFTRCAGSSGAPH